MKRKNKLSDTTLTKVITPGISDDEFIRGEVPMTKEEVRSVSICKLKLCAESVLYDIGSGTGSVAVEAARLSDKIKVFAVEAKDEAVELIKQNCGKFKAENVSVISGSAPEMLETLPAPTHAFIGGTNGKLKDILRALYRKNPEMRIVMTAVSLETVAEMQSVLSDYPVTDDEIVQVSIAKARKAGSHHLLFANNPVFVFAFTFKKV